MGFRHWKTRFSVKRGDFHAPLVSHTPGWKATQLLLCLTCGSVKSQFQLPQHSQAGIEDSADEEKDSFGCGSSLGASQKTYF